jgi:hypothetical protein
VTCQGSQVNRLLYLLASAYQRLWLVHANDACDGSHMLGLSFSLTSDHLDAGSQGDSLTAISIACAEDIVSTASDLIVANHAGADRLLRTEPQVHFRMNSC